MALISHSAAPGDAHVVDGALQVVSKVTRPLEYTASLFFQPSTITLGTIYAAFRNGNPARKVRLKRIVLHSGFSGTAANTASFFGIRKTSGSITGGLASAVMPISEQALVSAVDVRADNASGLTIGAAVVSASSLFTLGSSNIQHGGVQTTLIYENFILGSGEGLAIVADTAVVVGQRVSVSFVWEEFD